MLSAIRDIFQSIRKPHRKQVFFRSLELNRKLLLWYADRMVKKESLLEPLERLKRIDQLRRSGKSLTFICNHLTYADSHMIETLLIRSGFQDLASHMIHVAGQKTYELSRRFFTRSLNTVRVYQPKAKIDKLLKRKMNSRALKWAAHLKRRGYCLLVYPEGTRTRRRRQFNSAAANPKTTIYFRNSYVVPMALMGAERMMPIGKFFPEPACVHLRIGEPVEHACREKELRQENPEKTDIQLRELLMHSYMNEINRLLDAEYRDPRLELFDQIG